MDLAVSESYHFLPVTLQICETHRDHRRFFFLDVDKLDETLLAARLEVPSTTLCRGDIGRTSICLLLGLVEHHLNVPLADLQLIILNDVQGSLHAASVRAELNLALREVSDDRDLPLNLTVSPEVLEIRE